MIYFKTCPIKKHAVAEVSDIYVNLGDDVSRVLNMSESADDDADGISSSPSHCIFLRKDR